MPSTMHWGVTFVSGSGLPIEASNRTACALMHAVPDHCKAVKFLEIVCESNCFGMAIGGGADFSFQIG
jgi:hypothetical protein